MPVPLALAAPAAVAGLAYLNARLSLSYDAVLVRCTIPSVAILRIRERTDRLNSFYILERRAQSKPSSSRPLLLFEGKSYTYSDVYSLTLKYGSWLRQRFGVKPGDIVSIMFQNSDLFVFLWFGLWSIGAKPAFINYNLTGPALVHAIKTAKSDLVIIDPRVEGGVTEDVRKELGSMKLVIFTPDVEAEAVRTEPARCPNSDRSEHGIEGLAILIYTSGTTGLPKPAIVSWGKCTIGGVFTSRLLNHSPGDVFFSSMPLYHSSASVLGFLQTLEAGGTMAIGRKFSTRNFWNEVRACNATIIHYVGETCRYLVAAPPQYDSTGVDLDKIHRVRVAFGNGLRPDVWAQFKGRFGIDMIAEFYAATEAPLATWNLSRNDFSKGAVGRVGWLYGAIISMQIRLIEVDLATYRPIRDSKTGFCRRSKLGEPGEMVFRLDPKELKKRFQGYYGNPDASNEKVLQDVFKKGDAWFRTGDVVIWDPEGRILFSDRIGDTFRWKGENVSTTEVSQVLGIHPSVREANVYGVQLPHHDGRAGCVAIVFDGNVDESLLRSLATHVISSLPGYARPIFLRIMPELGLQTTWTNKHQKHLLRMQGVDPGAVDVGKLFWLKGGMYVPFGKREWDVLNGGKVNL